MADALIMTVLYALAKLTEIEASLLLREALLLDNLVKELSARDQFKNDEDLSPSTSVLRMSAAPLMTHLRLAGQHFEETNHVVLPHHLHDSNLRQGGDRRIESFGSLRVITISPLS